MVSHNPKAAVGKRPIVSWAQRKKGEASHYFLAVLLHGPSMFAVRAKIYGVLYNQASSIAFDETSSYWSALKRS